MSNEFWSLAAARHRNRPLVIGHRGAAGLCPENTLASIHRAAEVGADAVELDIRTSVEGEPVIIHDATLERTTDGHGPVSEHSLADLAELDAGWHWHDDDESRHWRGRGLRIPTLEAVLRESPLPMVLEIKQENLDLVERAGSMVMDHGRQHDVLVVSFSRTVMRHYRQRFPQMATGSSVRELVWFQILARLGLARLFPPPGLALQTRWYWRGLDQVSPAMLRRAHRLGRSMHVWTINDAPQMRELCRRGVDGIITDYPQRLAQVLQSPVNPAHGGDFE